LREGPTTPTAAEGAACALRLVVVRLGRVEVGMISRGQQIGFALTMGALGASTLVAVGAKVDFALPFEIRMVRLGLETLPGILSNACTAIGRYQLDGGEGGEGGEGGVVTLTAPDKTTTTVLQGGDERVIRSILRLPYEEECKILEDVKSEGFLGFFKRTRRPGTQPLQ